MTIEHRILKGSVRRALDLIGDRWTLLILLSAFCGVQRFEKWKSLLGMSPSILSRRLKRLTDIGVFVQQPIEPGSPRMRYELSEMGTDLFDWALAVWSWESVWVYRYSDHPLRLIHKTCGSSTHANFVCGSCDGRVGRFSVNIEPGPGYGAVPISDSSVSRRANKQPVSGDDPTPRIRGFVDIIGDRWSFLVIAAAYFGVSRFDDFQDQLHIATNVLSDRLQRLSEDGMLARNRYREKPTRYEYILTDKTTAFYQVPMMLALWGDKWLTVDEGIPFRRYHDHCGKELTVISRCSHCGEELKQRDIEVEYTGETRQSAKSRS